jgi:phosphatidylinositol N-acetylglucosaminyltransferase subunit H
MKSHLSVEAPSSTATEFVVSSRRPSSGVLAIIGYAVRVTVCYHALLVLLLKLQITGHLTNDNAYLELFLQVTVIDGILTAIAAKAEWWMLAASTALTFWLCLRRPYKEESLLVLQGMGVQTSTSSPYFFVGPTTTFISTTRIQDIVIHEAFKGFEVKFYLAIIVEGASEVVVVFPSLLPRLDVLQKVWRGARACLYAHATKPG